MGTFNLVENCKVVQQEVPKDYTGAAHTAEYVSMKYADKLYYIIQHGALTSTSNQAVTLIVADDASGTHTGTITSAGAACTLTMPHYWVRSGDTYTKTTVSSSTFNITKSDDNKTYIIEVDRRNMGTFVSTSVTYSADYVTLSIATPGAHACLRSIVAILCGYRYQEDSPPSAIT